MGGTGSPRPLLELRGPTSEGRGGDEKGREGKGKKDGRDPQWCCVHGARGWADIFKDKIFFV